VLVLFVVAGSGCGREKALSAPVGGDGRGQSPGNFTERTDGGTIGDAGALDVISRDAAPLDTSIASSVPDASVAPDSSAAKKPSGVWTNRTRGTLASGQWWTAVASDASGEHLVATSTSATIAGATVGGFWTSTDSGSTWTNRGADDLGAVASNSTGTVLIGAGGCYGGDGTWELTNSGATWSLARSGPGGISVASDAPGIHLVAGGGGLESGSTNGDLWTSSSSGASWTDQTLSGPAHGQVWTSIASSSTGTKLVALSGDHCALYGDIWTSTDSGVTWIDRTPTGLLHGARFTSVASDASGMNLVAVGAGILTSIDAGLTWTEQADPSGRSSSDAWVSVASDSTGKHLIVATYGDPGTGGSAGGGGGFRPERPGLIFTSTNAGVNWTSETAGLADAEQNWIGVASDATGAHLVAVAAFGDIWTN
jgi:hypothetical protein